MIALWWLEQINRSISNPLEDIISGSIETCCFKKDPGFNVTIPKKTLQPFSNSVRA